VILPKRSLQLVLKVQLWNDTERREEETMARTSARTADRKQTQGQVKRGSVGDDARERLLAGLPVTERRIRLAGISTAMLEGGDGPPLVLLHGPGEYAAKWMRVIPDLVTTHRVVAPDLPAHGASEAPDAGMEAERVLAWLDELIEHTCSSPPALVGQILGGAIAARFASRWSDRLARLVLVDALGLSPFQPAPEFGLARTASLRAGQQSLMAEFGMTAIPAEDLAQITVPTTLIWGRHDLATRLEIAEAASARYGWPLQVIDDAADDPPLEQPKAFLKALRGTLRNS
jgi:pimeloyl-ACP methyl ester carboxylesterase